MDCAAARLEFVEEEEEASKGESVDGEEARVDDARVEVVAGRLTACELAVAVVVVEGTKYKTFCGLPWCWVGMKYVAGWPSVLVTCNVGA